MIASKTEAMVMISEQAREIERLRKRIKEMDDARFILRGQVIAEMFCRFGDPTTKGLQRSDFREAFDAAPLAP
jgi:hypothetical protein